MCTDGKNRDLVEEMMALYPKLSPAQQLKLAKIVKERVESERVGSTITFNSTKGNVQISSDGEEVFILGGVIQLAVLYDAVCGWLCDIEQTTSALRHRQAEVRAGRLFTAQTY